MSSAWRSCKLRKDADQVSANVGLRKAHILKGSVSRKVQATQKCLVKVKKGPKPKETEYQRMKTRGVEWRRFYEEDDGSMGTKLRLYTPCSLLSDTTHAQTCDVVSHEEKGLVIHAAAAVNMSITIIPAKGISKKEKIKSSQIFHPLFTNQIFGWEQEIRGYSDLSINLSFTPATLYPLIDITYSSMSRNADQILKPLRSLFRGGYQINPKKHQAKLDKEITNFVPLGEKINEFQRKCKDTDILEFYEVYKINAGSPDFQQINLRLQAMILFFINGANFIYVDQNWNYFLLYKVISKNSSKIYQLVAYSTVYECPLYKSRIKSTDQDQRTDSLTSNAQNSSDQSQKRARFLSRISQFLVLPPFQRRGYGSALVEQIYSYYISDKQCKLIEVEDPNVDFKRLRDQVELKTLLRKGFFGSLWVTYKKKLCLPFISRDSYKGVQLKLSEIERASKIVKINHERVCRCFELALLGCLDPSLRICKAMRHEIKKKYYLQDSSSSIQKFKRKSGFTAISRRKYLGEEEIKYLVGLAMRLC